MKLSVCIATYRRADRLDALLGDLLQQECSPDEVIVVDNDVSGSARAVIERRRLGGYPFPLIYAIQPERSIAQTRNKTVELAGAEWLAFVDDDERPPPFWLRKLVEAADTFQADVVLAPVEPQVPPNAPAWIRRGKFYDWPHVPTGTPVPANMLRFGNALLRGSCLRAEPGPFDPAFGLSTGEDGDLLLRLIDKGAKVVWCDEAIVWEPIESKRLSLRWLLQRALSGGQHFARLAISSRYRSVSLASRLAMLIQWLAQLCAALILAGIFSPLGRHRSVAWLIKAAANLGKLTAILGWRYGEYA